jgi:la-related protein 1
MTTIKTAWSVPKKPELTPILIEATREHPIAPEPLPKPKSFLTQPKQKRKGRKWKKLELSPVQRQIKKQFEYYFSFENLVKDLFMKTLMTPQGFIPIVEIIKFRKLYLLLENNRVDLKSLLENSKIVQVRGDDVRAKDWEKWILPEEFIRNFKINQAHLYEAYQKNVKTEDCTTNIDSTGHSTTDFTIIDSTTDSTTNDLNSASSNANSTVGAKAVNAYASVVAVGVENGIKMDLDLLASAAENFNFSQKGSETIEPMLTPPTSPFIQMKIEEQKLKRESLQKETIPEEREDDLFQFDEEETWLKKNDDHFHLESDFDDEELDKITIVTQRTRHLEPEQHKNMEHRRHATTPYVRSKQDEDIADMINEGLYLYEKQQKPKSTPSKDEPKTPVKKLQKEEPVMSPKRFITGGLTAASPPIGWLVNQKFDQLAGSIDKGTNFGRSVEKGSNFGRSVEKSSSHLSAHSFNSHRHEVGAHSFNSNRQYSKPPSYSKSFQNSHRSQSSFGGRSFKEFQEFEHPSYELLKENGFIQHKYTKYQKKALSGKNH